MTSIYQMTIAELHAMQDIGMRVPDRAYELAQSEHLSEYKGMSVCEIADLLIQLAEVK